MFKVVLKPKGTHALFRLAISGVVACLLLWSWAWTTPGGWVQRLENMAYDWRIRLDLTTEKDPRVVILDIDESSLSREGRWPWPRERLAQMVDKLFERYGIALLAFDVLFAEPDREVFFERIAPFLEGSKSRPLLRQALKAFDPDGTFARSFEGRPVILGYSFTSQRQAVKGSLPDPLLVRPDTSVLAEGLRRAPGYSANLQKLQNAASGAGFFDNPFVDEDGVFRRLPLLQIYEGKAYPALSLAVLAELTGSSRVALEAGGDQGSNLEYLSLGGFRMPVDSRGAALVGYRGPQGRFAYVSAADVLEGSADASLLEGSLVLVGTTAAGLLDLRSTPVQKAYPGVEIHANMIVDMLDASLRHQPDYMKGANLLQCLLLAVVLVIAPVFLSGAMTTLLAILLATGVISVNLMLWFEAGHVLLLMPPLLILACLFIVQLLTGYLLETRTRRRLASLFGQYVPPELVDELSDSEGDLGLEGESREMTVLFSDIRGFTSLSENLSPQELKSLMQIYLTAMTAAIQETRGTIDKYIGDAVMAFWGAPLRDPDHAAQGVQASLNMLQALEGVNEDLRKQDLPSLKIGIGIHTGIMNVGNMGSEFRMAYTVLGDAVNLGSRIEGMTKFYGLPLLVSETVVRSAPDFRYRLVDRVRAKGKREAVAIYAPCLNAQEEESYWLDCHGQAMDAYQRQDWRQARESFRALQAEGPFDSRLYKVYLKRLELLESQTLPADWDAVFVHEEK